MVFGCLSFFHRSNTCCPVALFPSISYSTLYATTTPTTLDPWSIGSWHIGHGIDAAATPKSHSTHTARWLHGKDTSKTQKVLLLVIYTLQLLLVVGKSQKIVPAS